MAMYRVESMPAYRDIEERFIRANNRQPHALDKAVLQSEVILELVIRIDERLARLEAYCMPEFPEG